MAIEYSNGRDNLISYKAYIAGQYAPAQSVIAQSGVFSFSEARVSLFPHKELVNLGEDDRVPCQVFFLDSFKDPNYPEYKLMFDGEIVDWGYTRSANSVSMDISCVSNFEILAQMFLSLFSDFASKVRQDIGNITVPLNQNLNISALVDGGCINNFSDDPLYAKKDATLSYLFSKDYLEKASTGKTLFMQRPFVFLRNILFNLVNGINSSDAYKKDIHLFFKSFLSKRQLFTSIFASPYLENITTKSTIVDQKEGTLSRPTANAILDAIKHSATLDAFSDGFSFLLRELGQNQIVSFWELFVKIYSVLMYEALMPLCPPFLKADIFGVPAEGGTKYSGIMQLLSKPSFNFGVPPICNTIFPCMMNNVGVRNSHFTKPTRFFLQNPSIFTRMGMSGGGGNNIIDQLATNTNSEVYPNQLKEGIGNDNKDISQKIASSLMWSDTGGYNEYFKGPVALQNVQAPSWVNFVKKEISKTKDYFVGYQGEDITRSESSQIVSNIKSVLSRYSQNEFEKEVATRRVVTLDLKFNPYIVAGFPAAIIDEIDFGQYYLAMPVRVIHSLSVNHASTSVEFVNAITFKEAYYKSIAGSPGYDVGPLSPSTQVSNVFNKNEGAEKYYYSVFFQNEKTASTTVEDEVNKRTNKPLTIFKPENYFKLTSFKEIDTTVNNAEARKGVLVSKLDILKTYEEAMKHVARPIASMSQFLITKSDISYTNSLGAYDTIRSKSNKPHCGTYKIKGPKLFNGSDLTIEIVKKISNNRITSFSGSEPLLMVGLPVYFEQILGYTYLHQTDSAGNRMFTKRPTDLTDYPDFIEDWAGKIERYRRDILSGQDIYLG